MSEQDNNKNNEELNNNEKNTGEKAGEAINDTVGMAKEGADLAKNISTGNAAGIAKNAVNLLKNKQFRIRLIINALTPLIVIIIIAGALLGIFNAIRKWCKRCCRKNSELLYNRSRRSYRNF